MTEILDINIDHSWKEALSSHFETNQFKDLRTQVRASYLDTTKKIYPSPKNLFTAFNLCPFPDVKVVILGQDPYHGPNQAHGLSFSVPEGHPTPPSLKNIFKEIESDIGTPSPTHGNLTNWAKQGVFLLNAILTVEAGKPASHRLLGWETFTDAIIQTLATKREHLVFILWGSYAKKKEVLIPNERHLILTAPHPSPYSATSGFFGCKHFSKANAYLQKHNKPPITW